MGCCFWQAAEFYYILWKRKTHITESNYTWALLRVYILLLIAKLFVVVFIICIMVPLMVLGIVSYLPRR